MFVYRTTFDEIEMDKHAIVQIGEKIAVGEISEQWLKLVNKSVQ